jgi:hypothetical protein
VEAVLLHELAHIRRRDFVVNLFQHFAETIFFFNPALLWISARIREEREHCCDDMAITVMQSKTGYVRAIVSFMEFNNDARSKYALAFPGKKHQLLDRVKRIVHNSNKTLNMAEKSFLLLCLSLTGIIGLVYSQSDKLVHSNKEKAAVQAKPPITDSSVYRKAFEQLASERIDDAVLPDDLQVDDVLDTITPKSHGQYESRGDDSVRDVPVFYKEGDLSGTVKHVLDGTEYRIDIQNNKATGLTVNGKKVPDQDLVSNYPLIRKVFADIDKGRNAIGLNARNGNSTHATVVGNTQQTMSVNYSTNVGGMISVATAGTIDSARNKAYTVSTDSWYLPTPPVPPTPPAYQPRTVPTPPIYNTSGGNSAREKILNDMVSDGLIKSTDDDVKFVLTKKEFKINDKAITGELFDRYQKRYITSPSNAYIYSKDGNSRHSDIYVE